MSNVVIIIDLFSDRRDKNLLVKESKESSLKRFSHFRSLEVVVGTG